MLGLFFLGMGCLKGNQKGGTKNAPVGGGGGGAGFKKKGDM